MFHRGAMTIRKREEDELRDKKMMWLLGSVVVLFFLLWILFAPGRGFFLQVMPQLP